MIDWWNRHFLRLELAIATILASALGWWLLRGGGDDVVRRYLEGTQATFYTALSATAGALLGFMITTMSIVLALVEKPQMSILRSSERHDDLWGTFRSTARSLGALTLTSLVALVLDHETKPPHNDESLIQTVLLWLVLAIVIHTILRMMRSIWALHTIVNAFVARTAQTTTPPQTGDAAPKPAH